MGANQKRLARATKRTHKEIRMRANALLKEIREDQRPKARSFMAGEPPHPEELGAVEEMERFAGSSESNYDEILIHRTRQPMGNHVNQTIMATGVVLQGPDPKENLSTLLGHWGREEFLRKEEPSQEGPEIG